MYITNMKYFKMKNSFTDNFARQAALYTLACHRNSNYCRLVYHPVTGKHTLNAIHKFI